MWPESVHFKARTFAVFKVDVSVLSPDQIGRGHTGNAVGRSVQQADPIRLYSRLNTIIRHMTAVNRRGQRVLLRNKDDRCVVSTSLQNSRLMHYCFVCGEPSIDLARTFHVSSPQAIVWVLFISAQMSDV